MVNVSPGLGELYIVDSFMTVVVGGVGYIFGTVFSSLGIGMLDQGLQQILGNPVLGKNPRARRNHPLPAMVASGRVEELTDAVVQAHLTV